MRPAHESSSDWRRQQGGPRPPNYGIRADVVHLYEAGAASRTIASNLGISKATVLKILDDAGVHKAVTRPILTVANDARDPCRPWVREDQYQGRSGTGLPPARRPRCPR